MKCPLCHARPAKRACPGVNREICAVCCGTKRLVEIACPADCPYLASARSHPPAVVQRQQERDLHFLLPRISDLSDTQYQLFLFVQAMVLRHAREAMPGPRDVDVADAAATVAATLETAGKGIIYEHQAASIPAQRLAVEIGRAIGDLAERAGAGRTHLERDAAQALGRLERAAREAEAALPDQAHPASSWLTLAARLMAGAVTSEDANAKSHPDTPRIIL
jgi:hypothetical protein